MFAKLAEIEKLYNHGVIDEQIVVDMVDLWVTEQRIRTMRDQTQTDYLRSIEEWSEC